VVRRRRDESLPQRGRSAPGARAGQKALVYISTETGEEKSFSFGELHTEVQRAAAMMIALGVGRGDG